MRHTEKFILKYCKSDCCFVFHLNATFFDVVLVASESAKFVNVSANILSYIQNALYLLFVLRLRFKISLTL